MSDIAARNSFDMRMGVARLRMLPPATQLALAFQRLPPDTPLCPLAHEVVHHVSANSAVNVAMQGRWLELMRRTLSSPGFGALATPDDLQLAVGLAQAEALFQPLAEGLALFAEFDCALPTRADYARDPQLRTGVTDCMMFRLIGCKAGSGDQLDGLAAIERTERLGEAHIDRKASILSNPLRPTTGNDCYLVGYLAIKALWHRCLTTAGAHPPRAAAFLRYVHYFIYEDWGLTQAIVGDAFQSAVAARLASRYAALLTSDIAALVDAFDADITARTTRGMLARGVEERTHGPFAALGLTSDDLHAGMAALATFEGTRVGPAAPLAGGDLPANLVNATHALLVQPMPESPEVEALRGRTRLDATVPVRILDFVLDVPQKKRPLCVLVDLDVACWAAGAGMLAVGTRDGSDVHFEIAAPVADSLGGDRYGARLYAVLTSTACPWRLSCLLVAGGNVLAAWTHGAAPDNEELQRIFAVLNLEQQIEDATPIRFSELTTVYGTVLATERYSEGADVATQHIAEVLRDAIGGDGWGRLFAASHPRSEFGLRSVLSRGELRSLAALGLCNAFTTREDEIGSLLGERGLDLAAARQAAARVRDAHGVTLLDDGDGWVRARI